MVVLHHSCFFLRSFTLKKKEMKNRVCLALPVELHAQQHEKMLIA